MNRLLSSRGIRGVPLAHSKQFCSSIAAQDCVEPPVCASDAHLRLIPKVQDFKSHASGRWVSQRLSAHCISLRKDVAPPALSEAPPPSSTRKLSKGWRFRDDVLVSSWLLCRFMEQSKSESLER